MVTPPKSPDLNPIEWVWSDLKRFDRKRLCSCEQDLIQAVKEFWDLMTPQYCGNFINHMKKVVCLIKVIKKLQI